VELFLSYAQPDRSKADAVARRLQQAGNNVWFDTERAGGRAWWDENLRQLRRCDAAVVIVSRASLRSQACIRERQYAASLGKHVLPLTIEPFSPELLPSDLALLQVIDYSRPDEAAAFKLAGAIIRLPKPQALPDPLPPPPAAPISPLDTVAEQLKAESLGQEEQLAIIGKLESALAPSADPNERPVAAELLDKMAKRHDLLAAVDRRINLLRGGVPDPSAGERKSWTQGPPQWQQTPPRQAPPRQAPPRQAPPPPPPQWTGRESAPAVPDVMPVPHWAMAITSLIFFFPLGIPAVIMAQRTKVGLQTGDLETARKSAKTVKILFWIVVGLCVVLALSKA
jgi:TIR domain/Interferon-induced transmembrane protein